MSETTHAAVLTVESQDERVAALAGGKGRNLHRMARGGLPVPAWAVVGADVLERFRASGGLGEEIEAALAALTPETAEATAARIERAFAETDPDDAVLEASLAAYEHAGSDAVAVRSSGLDEDSATLSFAGQYASFLGIVGAAEVARAVVSCWASAYSARALAYRLANDLPPEPVEMGVIVQAIVASEKSGVAFTLNPTTGARDEIVISAVYGLGEGLVSGLVDADTVVLDRDSGRVEQTTVGEKAERVDASPDGGGTVVAAVDPERRDALCLEDAELDALRELAVRAESLFGGPQDVEWAVAGGEPWLLQSRPVTAAAPRPEEGDLRIWDNSNIIESYGEIVAPLTYTFARMAYERVYHDYARVVGVPPSQIRRMDAWLPNMLGCFRGRVYYNLLNWYKVIRLLPFYSVNRRVLELSMGVQEELTPELYDAQRPLETHSRAEELAIRAWVAARFAFQFFTIERSVERFTRDFYRVYDEFDAVDYAGRPAAEVYRTYRDVEERLLARWGRMIVLEATIGMAFGGLHALTSRWLPDAPEWLLFEAAKVEGSVESVRPAQRIDEMAALVRGDDSLRALLEGREPAEAYEALRSAGDDPSARRLLAEIDGYLDEFGYRNANELKLEEPDLREDPSILFSMLQGAVARLAAPRREGARRESADDYLDAHLRGWRRRVYELVRRKVRHSLGARETVRFCRTRAFGMARRMFRAIGDDLARTGALDTSRDVFHLRLEELYACFEGELDRDELRGIVESRKAQEAEDRKVDPPPRFETRGDPDADLARAWSVAELGAGADGEWQELRGTPASPGVAVGAARVVDRPCDIGGDVLVTYRTDPGWVAALTSASALLIERGSPLTHVAIVARELGVPTVVQIPGLTKRVTDGTRIRVDGSGGTVAVAASEEGE